MNNLNKQKKMSFPRKETWVVILGIFIAFFGIASPFFIFYKIGKPYKIGSFQNIGVVGDFFGGTSVGLLSFASMIFVFAAIVMQKEELKLQREEVEKTRNEFVLSNSTMKKQLFDNTFFNMISLHNEILSQVEINPEIKGRKAFVSFYQSWNYRYTGQFSDAEVVTKVYEDFYSDYQFDFEHYYRNLYRIVKYIVNSGLDQEEENFYLGIIRAQLSSLELIMLFYNISYSEVGMKFKTLLVGKNFFQKHIPENLIIMPKLDNIILNELK